MKRILKLRTCSLFGILFFSCANDSKHLKIGTADELRKELKGVENEKITPSANIGELEAEVNNGGLNQYFFNSSGQNCFETLRLLKNTGKIKTAAILEQAIITIDPNKLSEEKLIEKLRKREVEGLDNDSINAKLDSLDNEFFKYPDGEL